jgi:tetratricopeptide (TPR) repeat protein
MATMSRLSSWILALLGGLSLGSPTFSADESSADTLMKMMAAHEGNITPGEKKLYQQSIQSTKESVARETLDVFYHDALDFYHRGEYDEALQLLDNIYSIDPYYEDVSTLRETIRRLKSSHDIESKRGILEDYMKKGNTAFQQGKTVAAIGFWKQALIINPSYGPAKRKIFKANHDMAQKQYEAGYLYYHHGDLEEALDSWSNAIALDPSFKQRGLLMLMSKVQISLRKDQITKLSTQGSDLYQQHNLMEALQSYEQVLNYDPRNEEARRMVAKIRIQLGMAAYKSARDAYAQSQWSQAIKHWQDAVRYGYEVQKSKRGIQEAEQFATTAREERNNARVQKPTPAAAAPAQTAAPAEAAAPAAPTNPEEASEHYREALRAIRSKDYHRAVEECEIASKLNPNDEHIYVACQRAKQEWASINAGKVLP